MARMAENQTKVTSAKPETISVRTTIPNFVAKTVGIRSGDTLDWSIDKKGKTWEITIKKVNEK